MEFFRRVFKRIKRITNTREFKRFAPLVFVALVALVAFVTCVPWQEPQPEPPPFIATPPPPAPSTSPTPSPSPTPEPTPSPTPEPTPEPDYTGPLNPLTGLPTQEDISGNRPLAIMINNHRGAQPQLGVSRADIIYEVLAEGGITRMLALYQDVSDVGLIGSIRSARTYYVDIAQSYDAIFIHAGGSNQAYSALTSRNITRCDGVQGPHAEIFYRDPNRKQLSYEHQLVTTGTRISQNLPTYNNFRMVHADGYKRDLSFIEDGTPEGGAPAVDFTVKFGGSSKTTSFKYKAEDNLYYLRQYNSDYRDGNDKTQVAVTNVLILRTSISGIPGDTEGRLDIKTTGRGSGYYICGGKYVEIDWSRADIQSQYQYTNKDGSELELGQGKTYVCIIYSSVDLVLE